VSKTSQPATRKTLHDYRPRSPDPIDQKQTYKKSTHGAFCVDI